MNLGKTLFAQGHGLPAVEDISPHRGKARWRQGCQIADLRRAVSSDGLRATDLTGELARHRSLSVGPSGEALSHGDWRIWADFAGRLIAQARELYAIYVMDRSYVDFGRLHANQMTLPAATICALYKSRWQVELFFKWIKQHLRIKRFFGTRFNRTAVTCTLDPMWPSG